MSPIARHSRPRGFSLVELLVTAAVVSLVFGGLLVSLKYSIALIGSSKARAGALALANEQVEYIRSLPYSTVGTIAGIPDGPIPQNSTTTLNGLMYYERVVVQYVDAPDDGEGVLDDNGILADYKQVKVEYSWSDKNGSSTISLLTNVVPPGIESTAGGGTLVVNVFDASVQPVSGAEVHVYNDTTTSTIDTIRYTNASGIAMFAGAPAAANYQIRVTQTGYSTDQTYLASSSNPNPTVQPVAVLESAVSTMNFQIDELSDLTVRTVGPSTDGAFDDAFDDLTEATSSSNVEIVAGSVSLSGGAGAYAGAGSLFSIPVTPGAISAWDLVRFDANTATSTSVRVSVYSVTGGTYTLIPDSDLPGNSTGFSMGPINISALDEDTYGSLALAAILETSDPNVTPLLDMWEISYVVTEPPISGIPFSLTGNKTIGTTASATPIYKYSESHTTDGTGEVEISGLEWDVYDLTVNTSAYTISEACNNIPYVLPPGEDHTLTLTLVPAAPFSMRVSVVDIDGDPIAGADVELSRPGLSQTLETSSCGQAYFDSGLVSALDYSLTVNASGYTSEVVSNITIDGSETTVVTLSP